MDSFSSRSLSTISVLILLACLLISAAAAADIEMEGTLGETINLHGVSYVGDKVYLFLTGPGLPDNGVTLTNTDLRADQGQFTVVGVDENQEWSYSWKTSRIMNEIDPGTYIVYVTNEPVDKAHLGGTSSYKTLSIYLKDSGESKVSVNSGTAYTLNPEEHPSTERPAPSLNFTSPSTVVTTPPATTASPPLSPAQTASAAPTKASTGSLAAVVAFAGCAGLFCRRKSRR